jgi:hypothetical protein
MYPVNFSGSFGDQSFVNIDRRKAARGLSQQGGNTPTPTTYLQDRFSCKIIGSQNLLSNSIVTICIQLIALIYVLQTSSLTHPN